jgi:5-methylcytosine-specific restriction endonuclease McrA
MTPGQEILDHLISRAETLGRKVVERACKDFLKRKSWTGKEVQKRKSIPRGMVEKALDRQGGLCHRGYHELSLEEAVGDHLIPHVEGGPIDQTNIVALCKSCNSKKGANSLLRESKLRNRTIKEMLDTTDVQNPS